MKVIERHLVAIAAENDESPIIDNSRMPISRRRSLVFNFAIRVLLRNWRRIHILRHCAGRLGDTELVFGGLRLDESLLFFVGNVRFVIIVELWASIFDQNRVHHGDRGDIT